MAVPPLHDAHVLSHAVHVMPVAEGSESYIPALQPQAPGVTAIDALALAQVLHELISPAVHAVQVA